MRIGGSHERLSVSAEPGQRSLSINRIEVVVVDGLVHAQNPTRTPAVTQPESFRPASQNLNAWGYWGYLGTP